MFVLKFETDSRNASAADVQAAKRVRYVTAEDFDIVHRDDGSYQVERLGGEPITVDGEMDNYDRCYVMNEQGQTVDKVDAGLARANAPRKPPLGATLAA